MIICNFSLCLCVCKASTALIHSQFYSISMSQKTFLFLQKLRGRDYLLISVVASEIITCASSLMFHGTIRVDFVVTGLIASFIVTLWLNYFTGIMRSALQAERDKVEDILTSIVPQSIAVRLKQGEDRIAEYYDNVSILFADIQGFTALSTTIKPIELVIVLDEIFTQFDSIADKYHLEKIKTIGDSYMMVGGAPHTMPDHPHRIALAALEMCDYMEKFNPIVALPAMSGDDRSPLRVRIGIHSGEVIAGVIGSKKPVFDLWGDAVNTASRMESYGEAGKIHVSETFRHLLGDRFIFEERDAIMVKGKGEMKTFFLISGSAQ